MIRPSQRPIRRRKAIAARELTVLALALAAVVIVLAPWILQRRTESRRITCEFRQLQVATAILRWENRAGRFPGPREDVPAAGREIGWLPLILDGIDRTEQSESPWAAAASLVMGGGPEPSTPIPSLLCPAADPPEGGWGPQNHWVLNMGMPDAAQPAEGTPVDWMENGISHDQTTPLAQAVSLEYLVKHDGSNATLLLTENMDAGRWFDAGERHGGFLWRADFQSGQATRLSQHLLGINELVGRGDRSLRFARPASFHAGGVNVVYASERTQFLSQAIDYVVFTQLLTTFGAETKRPGSVEPVATPYRYVPLGDD